MFDVNTFRLGLVQCSLRWESPADNLRYLADLALKNRGAADLIVLPEMFTTGFTMNPVGKAINESERSLEELGRIAGCFKAHIAASFIWKESSQYFNRFLLIGQNRVLGHYDKHHLFSLSGEDKIYQRGMKSAVWTMGNFRLGPYVCYDLRFPEWCRNRDNLDVMLFTANWPVKRIQHWRSLLIARAIENQCYVVGVNRTGTDGNGLEYNGQSLVVNANGDVVLDCGSDEGLRVIEVNKVSMISFRQQLPFLQDRE